MADKLGYDPRRRMKNKLDNRVVGKFHIRGARESNKADRDRRNAKPKGNIITSGCQVEIF